MNVRAVGDSRQQKRLYTSLIMEAKLQSFHFGDALLLDLPTSSLTPKSLIITVDAQQHVIYREREEVTRLLEIHFNWSIRIKGSIILRKPLLSLRMSLFKCSNYMEGWSKRIGFACRGEVSLCPKARWLALMCTNTTNILELVCVGACVCVAVICFKNDMIKDY